MQSCRSVCKRFYGQVRQAAALQILNFYRGVLGFMSDTFIFFTPEQIRQVRKKLGITQAKFGKRVGNVTAGTVSRWEKGKMTPTQAHFKIIAQLAASTAAKQPAADAAGCWLS